MLQIFGWAICIYLVIKAAHAMARPVPAFVGPEPTFRDGLRAGEPMLLIAALSVSIFATMYLDWWFHRLGEREYFHARGCYVQLEALKLLPREQTRFNPDAVERQERIYLWNAQKHGSWLGWGHDGIRRDFERTARSYLARHVGSASPRATAALIDDVVRCFEDDWEAHGEMFNP